MSVRHRKLSQRLRTYQTNILAKVSSGRKFTQNGYGLFEGLQDFVRSPEFTEGLCLFMENSGNGLDGVTILKSVGEWMLSQCYARFLFVVLQGSLKKDL